MSVSRVCRSAERSTGVPAVSVSRVGQPRGTSVPALSVGRVGRACRHRSAGTEAGAQECQPCRSVSRVGPEARRHRSAGGTGVPAVSVRSVSRSAGTGVPAVSVSVGTGVPARGGHRSASRVGRHRRPGVPAMSVSRPQAQECQPCRSASVSVSRRVGQQCRSAVSVSVSHGAARR